MKYREYLDVILALLYLRRTERPDDSHWINLRWVTDVIPTFPQRPGELSKLAALMEGRGDVLKENFPGGVRVAITPAGLTKIEGDAALEYARQFTAGFYDALDILESKSSLDIMLDERRGLFALLVRVRQTLESCPRLAAHDLILDAMILELELQKTAPDPLVITRKLRVISEIPVIREEYLELVELLPGGD